MKCPRCGGEIPAFDLKPNCKHCGVNILFYTQQSQLALDAKRTELEAAAARMVIARIKMNFIGGKLQIARIVLTVLAAAALLVPFGSVRFTVPYFTQTFSAGLIGFIQAFQNGFLMQLPSFLNSALLSRQTLAAVIPTAFLLLCAVLDVLLLAALLLGFLNLTRSARFARGASLVGAILCAAAQIVQLLLCVRTPKTPLAAASVGPGQPVAVEKREPVCFNGDGLGRVADYAFYQMVGGGFIIIKVVFLGGKVGEAAEIVCDVQRHGTQGVGEVQVDFLVAPVEGQVSECLGRKTSYGGLQDGVEIDFADFFSSPKICAFEVGGAAYLQRIARQGRGAEHYKG